ncbi:MAG: hypothetical protein SOW18_02335 [Peptoniphilus sp.]|nr:hypothetical protein [Peptoniphilus sp.]MDY3118358.1 hypothetical protein [Peptoniphilus sp.]
MNFKHVRKRMTAGALAAVMVTTALPISVFAETYKLEGSDRVYTTDWQLTEENLKGKNYWPLANGQILHPVSRMAEPLKNPTITYNGYFTRPDGRTVLRLSFRHFDKIVTDLWRVMQMKLEDSLDEKVDWNDVQTGIYKGVSQVSVPGWYHDDEAYKEITPFGTTNITEAGTTNVREANVYNNKNIAAGPAVNDIPINLVLKKGVTMESFDSEPLVQIRMMYDNRKEVAAYVDEATGKTNYNAYTFSTIVPLKHDYEQNLLREIYRSVTTDRAFRAGYVTVNYNKEKGYIDVTHRYNKKAFASEKPQGQAMGYRQTVDKRFFDVLKPRDADGTVAYIFATANNGLPSKNPDRVNKQDEPTVDGAVPVLQRNINFPQGSDVGFIQVATTDFYRDQEAQAGVKTNTTALKTRDSWMDGSESLLNAGQGTTVRYYVDSQKLDKLMKEGDGLVYFPFYSSVIEDNEKGQYRYDYTLDEDVTLNPGDTINIAFENRYGKGTGSNEAGSAGLRTREMRIAIKGDGNEMFLGSNFYHMGYWVSGQRDNGMKYEYRVQQGMGMKLKKGTKITLYGNYPDGGKATIFFNGNEGKKYQANYTVDHNPVTLDWQATYSAGTTAITYQKPDVDEIFVNDTKISGRTIYENAEINIKKSKADKKVQTILAKPGTNGKDNAPIDVVVAGVKEKGYEFDTKVPGKDKTFTMPTLERDMPILFTNTAVELLAGESKPPVVEQVQAKVNFDLNGVTSKENKGVIEKIAPLSAEYKYDIETGEANAKYQASGFEGANVKKDAQGTLLDHDGNPLKGEALKLRQMPTKDDINLPQGKKLLGWTTVKLAAKDGKTVAEQFNELKESKKVVDEASDWTQAAKEAYIFGANSPIDTNRTVYAVYGEGINIILHSNNTADEKDEQTITVPVSIADIDKTDKILDAVASATLNNSKGKLAIKELPKVPVTGEQAEIDKVTDTKAKTFNIPGYSFIGWTSKRYTNDPNTSGLAAGNNNERIGEITKGLVANGTKRIPQKTEWLKELNVTQSHLYIPNGYSVALRAEDINKAYADDLKKAIEEGADIHLFANYRPFFNIDVVASYKNIDPAQGTNGKYVDTVDSAKKKAAKIGLLRRTAVTNYGTPTVHQNANYYPLGDAGLKDWDGTEQTLKWTVPGFDELGQRLSYVSAVIPAGKEDAYKNFKVPDWGSLGLKTYVRLQDATATVDPNAPKNIHENAGNPYGDPLAKSQAYSIGVDAFTSATSRKSDVVIVGGRDEVVGYTIWNTSTPLEVPKPAFDNVYDTDTEAKLIWGDAEKNADIKTIKLTVPDGGEVELAKQPDGTYSGGGFTAREGADQDAGKLIIGTLNLTGKANKDIVAKYVVEKAGQDVEGPEGRVTINEKGTSAPVEKMDQAPNTQDGKAVVEFDIPNPTLNKPTPGTEYVAQKWDKETSKWVDAGKTTMEDGDTLGGKKTITLDGVTNDDVIRIVSKQPGMLPSASNKDGDNAINNNDVADRNYVKIDLAGPAVEQSQATDEAFRRFVDLKAILSEIPEGRKVHVKVDLAGKAQEFDYEVTPEGTKASLNLLNTILREGVNSETDPVITITAVDAYGNKTEKVVDYTKTYQLVVEVKGHRSGRKFVNVRADRDNAQVTLRVVGQDNSELSTATVTAAKAGTYVKATFANGYKLKSGDRIVVSGTCTEAGKTYTTNPRILDIK